VPYPLRSRRAIIEWTDDSRDIFSLSFGDVEDLLERVNAPAFNA